MESRLTWEESKALRGDDPRPSDWSRPSDEALVARARGGDATGLEQLYVRYREHVYNLCLSIIGDRDEAQDLLQETFVRAHRALPRFRGDAQFSTWLHRIALNLCQDALRRRKRTAGLASSLPEQGAEPLAAAQEVRAALLRLRPRHRIVLALRYQQALSYQEIADLLRWPLGRVKVTLHRAKRAFKEAYLGAEGDEP
jgi:RNA polymerase sigma-70 factor (ECF subfamily)